MIQGILALTLAFATSLAPGIAQAETHFTATDMNIGSGAARSAHFGESGVVAGMFQHIYEFVLPVGGLASGTISTGAVRLGDSADLDIGSVNDFVFTNAVPITVGTVNQVVISGLSRGNGPHGGQGVFLPFAAVPEPAAWAMLIGGSAFAGLSLRRHARAAPTRA